MGKQHSVVMEKQKTHRLEKINQLLKEEVGHIILKDLDIDKRSFITLTRVETSSDLAHATIFFSTLASAHEHEALTALLKNTPFIQRELNRKLRMRPVPKIRFALDASLKKEQRLYDILSNSHDNDEPAHN